MPYLAVVSLLAAVDSLVSRGSCEVCEGRSRAVETKFPAGDGKTSKRKISMIEKEAA